MQTNLIPLGSYGRSNDGYVYKIISYCGKDYKPVLVSGPTNVHFYRVKPITGDKEDWRPKMYKAVRNLKPIEGTQWKLLYETR